MIKKLIFLTLLIATFLTLTVIWLNQDRRDIEQVDRTPSKSVDNDNDHLHIVDKIFTYAQEGKIIDVEVIVGKTGYDQIREMYGEPERIDATSVGEFAIYQVPQVTVGYQDFVAFDLRSYEKYLQDIHFQDLLDRLGEPDEIKYYHDYEHDQTILIYQVNSRYQLKWILNRPNDNEPNPAVDHLSVVAMEITNPNDQDLSLTIPQLIEKMSLDEKIGQMIFAGISGTEMNIEAKHLIKDKKVGGIIINGKNISNPTQTVAYINALKAVNINNKIPLFFGIDQEGGRISKLPGDFINIPSNMEIGNANNPTFSFEIGSLLGRLVSAYGFNIDFAPVLDVNSNPDNPVIGDRSFGSNPDVVSELGIQTMKGLQSEKVIPTIKHFPGHGDTSVDSHLELPTVNKSLSELQSLELIPFSRAINEGADMVMIAHLLLPKLDEKYPSSLSEKIMTGLLRNQIGFEGVIITDDMTMDAITNNFEIERAAVLSVKGGSDVIMVAHDYENVSKVFLALKKAVESGEIQEERIDESVRRILELKEKYEITDSMSPTVNIDELQLQIETVLSKYIR